MASPYLVFLLSTYAHAAPLAPANSSAIIAPLWVPEPQGRGTVGILLNCFFTLSICVWTALHLNIDVRPLFWDRLLITAKYVALGMFWPETVLYTASGQWLAARCLVLGARGDNNPGARELLFSNLSDHENLTMEVAFYALMGGFVYNPDSGDSDSSEEIMLSYDQLKRLVKESLLTKETLKKLHREVENLSNTDRLAKVLACVKASWFVVQYLAREANGLPVILIELHTATHVMCALLAFLFWLRKPQYVKHRIVINNYVEKSVSQRQQQAHDTNIPRSIKTSPAPPRKTNTIEVLNNFDGVPEVQRGDWLWWKPEWTKIGETRAKNFNLILNDDARTLNNYLMAVFSVAYGSVHLTAWNAHFPTEIEQCMWRASSFILIGWFPCFSVIAFLFKDEKIPLLIFGFICGAARLFFLEEVFFSFRSLPLDAYKTVTWSNYWPHF
ncbi:hypothetical protein RUND412_002875 [Rhizina undulata]